MDIENFKLDLAERRFVDEMATLLEPWGMARSVGRVYGYLLLHPEPVDVDRIADHLEMSRSGAWNAARELERFGHVRRQGVPGSKRALFVQSDDFAAPLRAQLSLLAAMAKVLKDCASSRGRDPAAEHLLRRAGFYLAMRDAMEVGIEESTQRLPKERAGLRRLPHAADVRSRRRKAGSRV